MPMTKALLQIKRLSRLDIGFHALLHGFTYSFLEEIANRIRAFHWSQFGKNSLYKEALCPSMDFFPNFYSSYYSFLTLFGQAQNYKFGSNKGKK